MKNKINLKLSVTAFLLLILWTALVLFIDVKEIGPENSKVGLSSLNGFFHGLTGVNFSLYLITDWLSLIPVFIVLGFGVFGLAQLIKRKSIKKVDFDILVLGVFYMVTFSFYILFEFVKINFRPILIDGVLETSYPSSTTMLVLCVMSTLITEIDFRIKNLKIKKMLKILTVTFILFMVIGRMISGVHWLSDIIAGVLLSLGLIFLYKHFIEKVNI